jgi:hypothetical protein
MDMWDQKRFWSRVEKSQDGCWRWKGTTHKGYGIHSEKGMRARAHRLAWEMQYLPIPDDLCIDHLCRVKSRVNPDHLEVVTWAENGRRAHQQSGVAQRIPVLRASCGRPKRPAGSLDLPDSPYARAYFERRKVVQGEHWIIDSKQQVGTPALLIEGRLRPAHRLSYSWWVAPLRSDEVVRRTCGLETCLRPEHLIAVSFEELAKGNTAGIDRWRKQHRPTADERAALAAIKEFESARLEAKALCIRQLAALMPDESWLAEEAEDLSLRPAA